jgi:hypothetical protein
MSTSTDRSVDRPREAEPLPHLAVELAQARRLGVLLDALGGGDETEPGRELDDRRHDRCVLRTVAQTVHASGRS